MNEAVIVALATFAGAIVSALVAVYIARRTSRSADAASQRDDEIETDKFGLAELRELAIQNRADRKEWREERGEMKARLDSLEKRVADLTQERIQDRKTIEQLTSELSQGESLRHTLVRYVRDLREFIAGLGGTPPEPELPIPLD